MGGSTGLDVLRRRQDAASVDAVILMTAFGSVSTAVEAMKAGAFDYVQKPFEIEEMEVKIEKALEMRRMQHEIDYLRTRRATSTTSTASSDRAARSRRCSASSARWPRATPPCSCAARRARARS
jgi:DNA-binding NtrC family response regulator